MSTEISNAITADELLRMPDSSCYELVDGHLVERNMGSESCWIGGQIFYMLMGFCKAHKLGWVWPGDNSFQAFPETCSESAGLTLPSSVSVGCLEADWQRGTKG